MKSKLVLWGSNAQDEKLMIAIALRVDDNKVDIYTFPESVATENFYQSMMKQWRDGEGLELPEHTHIERELSISESLLPDDLKVERTDVVQRAQTEWHFLVLSGKLNQSYADRLGELKSRVEKLEEYDQSVWDSLKEFWGKVQEQVRERNLLRGHADKLRDGTNGLFSEMKKLRTKMDEEFDKVSEEAYAKFMETIGEVEKKVENGGRLNALFDELKNIQRQFKNAKLNRQHRKKVWDKLDAAFKDVKRRRFGDRPADEGNSPLVRTQRRYDGLLNAIQKMERSIKRDRNDLDFQKHKISTTSGQLEAQIRQAKLKMIEERVVSKEEKLADMVKTKLELEARLEKLKAQEARRQAEADAKAKIAAEAKANAETTAAEAKKLAKAAEEIAEGKKKVEKKAKTEEKEEESMLSAATAALGDSLTDVVDTVKAVASVVADQVEDAIEDAKEELKEIKEDVEEAMKSEPEQEEDVVAEAAEIAAAVDEAISEN